jgi:hypothetical protein
MVNAWRYCISVSLHYILRALDLRSELQYSYQIVTGVRLLVDAPKFDAYVREDVATFTRCRSRGPRATNSKVGLIVLQSSLDNWMCDKHAIR